MHSLISDTNDASVCMIETHLPCELKNKKQKKKEKRGEWKKAVENLLVTPVTGHSYEVFCYISVTSLMATKQYVITMDSSMSQISRSNNRRSTSLLS